MAEPGGFLRETIESQPAMANRLLADAAAVERAAETLRGARRIFVVGTGTSFHGALVGEHLLRYAGIDAFAIPAFEFAAYPPVFHADDGLLMISHRGTKRFSKAALAMMEVRSARWAVICGEGAPIDGPTVVRTVPQERSPVHTASHTGAMIRLAQLAAALDSGQPAWSALAHLPKLLEQAVALQTQVAAIAGEIRRDRPTVFVGGGPAWANALEGALKLREAAYIPAEGQHLEGLIHGPLLSVAAGDVTVVIAEPGPAMARNVEVTGALRAIGARVVVVGSDPDQLPYTVGVLRTPALPEVLAPIVDVVPLQWLAYEVSCRLGVDADSFRRGEAAYAAAQSRYAL